MIKPTRITAPAVLPVSVEEAKSHGWIDHPDDDVLLGLLVGAAVDHLDGYPGILGRALIHQTWEQKFRGWQSQFTLPMPMCSDVSVQYLDLAGDTQTVALALLEVTERHTGTVVRIKEGFVANTLESDTTYPVTIRFTAGYGSAPSDVPADIRLAILRLVKHLYDRREETTEKTLSALPMGINALLSKYRWRKV